VTAVIGLLSAILGALLGAIATYLTTRSNMRLALEHSYDQVLQGKRLERYQALIRVTKCLPRYWPPTDKEPERKDLE
jgi:membrane protein DedA with SNARE-associated domain